MGELAELLRGKARDLYPSFVDRLVTVEQMSNCVGWGFHDYIADTVGQLYEELSGS